MDTSKLTICWIRHGERQDRTGKSGITEESKLRLEKIGKTLSQGYSSIEIIYGTQKRAQESAEALAKKISAQLMLANDVDELEIDEKHQKTSDGKRVSGAELFKNLITGTQLSSKETTQQYIDRLLNLHNTIINKNKNSKNDKLIIIVHHDFGLDLVLKELLKNYNIDYPLDPDKRFQREEYVLYNYELNEKIYQLKQISIPTKNKEYVLKEHLSEFDLDFLKDYKWELMYREQANVFAFFMALNCRTARMDKTVGINYKSFIAKIDNNFFTLYTSPSDSLRVSEFILNRIVTEKDWAEKMSNNVYSKAKSLLTFSRSLKTIDYSSYTNLQLWSLYQQFCHHFMGMRVYSSIPTNLEHGTNVLTQLLHNKLGRLFSNKEEANEIFSILTTPNKNSYLREEQISLLEAGRLLNTPEFEKKIEEHTSRFTWKNYAFEGIPLQKQDFTKEILNLKEAGTDFDAELNKISTYHPLLRKKQQEIIVKYNVDEELQRLFSVGKEFVFIKFFRKGTFAESYYNVEFLLKAIAAKLNTDLKTIRGMLFEEVREALLNNIFHPEKITRRIADGFIISLEGSTLDLPQEYRSIVLQNVKKPKLDELSQWHGQTACAGSAKGRVKIINTIKDIVKMNEGDILISRSTNPDLVPAMKKAAAIVTELGGLTCHAAIVSRELGTPCVVGIDHITDMLKDNELIEVNASKGTVRRVKQ